MLSDEDYRAERKVLIDAKREGARTLDKGILTLSAAALGLSFTLLHDQKHVSNLSFLFLAWGGFILSILSTLVSQLTNQAEMSQLLEHLDRHRGGDRAAPRSSRFGKATTVLNLFSILFFVAGVIAMAVFSASLIPT